MSVRISRSPGVVYRELDEGLGLLHLASGSFYRLNVTGALIWELIEDSPTHGQLLAALTQRVEEHPHDVAGQLDAFLDSLRELQLIQVVATS